MVCTVTTDNATNIKAAIRLTEWGYIGYYTHRVNLVVKSGLEICEVKRLEKSSKQ